MGSGIHLANNYVLGLADTCDSQLWIGHRFTDLGDVLLVEAHQAKGDQVERDRVGGGDD